MNIPVIIIAGCAVVVGGLFAVRRLESMKGESTDELRAYLRSEWPFYRNALLELRRRGEDIKQEVMPILNLLISDEKRHRMAGWLILKELYPELASRIADYKPVEPVDVCKEKMQKIFLSAKLS